jgi:hypothetical protein
VIVFPGLLQQWFKKFALFTGQLQERRSITGGLEISTGVQETDDQIVALIAFCFHKLVESGLEQIGFERNLFSASASDSEYSQKVLAHRETGQLMPLY